MKSRPRSFAEADLGKVPGNLRRSARRNAKFRTSFEARNFPPRNRPRKGHREGENEAKVHEAAHEHRDLDFRRLKTFQTKILRSKTQIRAQMFVVFTPLLKPLLKSPRKGPPATSKKSADRAEALVEGKATARKARNQAVLFVDRGAPGTDST